MESHIAQVWFVMRVARGFYTMLIVLLALIGPADAGLFGTTELRRSGIGQFTKWTEMLERQYGSINPSAGGGLKHAANRSGNCMPNPRYPCVDRKTRDTVLASFKTATRIEQVRGVNTAMNQQRYITDMENWGIEDYWETLYEFLDYAGDCEDYAISKYMLLKELGVPVADMRIVIVQDENLGVAHAILAVKVDDTSYILDNQVSQVLPDTAVIHYKPFYSINENNWWVHLAKP